MWLQLHDNDDKIVNVNMANIAAYESLTHKELTQPNCNSLLTLPTGDTWFFRETVEQIEKYFLADAMRLISNSNQGAQGQLRHPANPWIKNEC